jgi:hypothetical protein
MALIETTEMLTGALILKADRSDGWLRLSTTKGNVHVAGGRVRLDLECPRCGEFRLVEIVETAGKQEGVCSVCAHAWVLGVKPIVRLGSTGE